MVHCYAGSIYVHVSFMKSKHLALRFFSTSSFSALSFVCFVVMHVAARRVTLLYACIHYNLQLAYMLLSVEFIWH